MTGKSGSEINVEIYLLATKRYRKKDGPFYLQNVSLLHL